MPQIEISDKTYAKLSAFVKVIDIIAETKPEDEINYAELVLSVGIERLLRDVFPVDNKLLQDSMVQMFERNPSFVCEFIADTLEAGTPRTEVKDRWNLNPHVQ